MMTMITAKGQRGGSTGDRGQIAIFVALIFQVLFVFFAMVVNVGLLVHHKINLQNSVDLAAYYGAMKQAESMNAIAHVNYQLRQAWKLMVWRYRMLGMAGDTINHPYDSVNKTLRGPGSVDQPFTAANGQVCPTSFCINYPVFDLMEPNEDYCRDMCAGVNIPLLGIPSENGINFGLAEGILGSLARSIEDASRNLVDKTKRQCRISSSLTWFALARFILAYRQEMKNRKQVLNHLANDISYSTTDLRDIDGDSVRAGAATTFYKNLTAQNQEQIDINQAETGSRAGGAGGNQGSFTFYNALGETACQGTDGNDQIPPKWLNEIFLTPLYVYLEGDCDGHTSIGFEPRIINAGGTFSKPRYGDGLDPAMIDQLVNLITDPNDLNAPANRLWHTTVGYEKNPWCAAYVGVQATTSPKIPFSPFGAVKLTARAFAKPFGGRIGPWYYREWPQGAAASQGADKIDPNLPPRMVSGEAPPAVSNDSLQADFSRYTGDQIGTKSTLSMGQVTSAIWQRNQPPTQAKWDYYNHLISSTDLSDPASTGDILAWDSQGNKTVALRDLEIAFVIPDQFDITYYSIEPDFWRNYAVRLMNRDDFANTQVRGDLGYRKGAGQPYESMTVRDQIVFSRTNNIYPWNMLSYYIGANQGATTAFIETLTSWHMTQPGDYRLDPVDRFGQCQERFVINDAQPPNAAVPGNCFAGGRTGYSVKMVDGEYLQGSDLEFGGEGVSGPLSNAWTEDSFK
ncbi:MAG: hypothetical protein C5B49_14245 [Bdellovibrio sp.]|nr:MAG: hypothetical protein C5B49_14245 [Bdellovibrio sp.]